jgi:hypothetical protein
LGLFRLLAQVQYLCPSASSIQQTTSNKKEFF